MQQYSEQKGGQSGVFTKYFGHLIHLYNYHTYLMFGVRNVKTTKNIYSILIPQSSTCSNCLVNKELMNDEDELSSHRLTVLSLILTMFKVLDLHDTFLPPRRRYWH